MSRSPPLAVPPETQFTLRTFSSPIRVRAAIEKICLNLREIGFDGQWCSVVELVLAEALNNVAEHAYRGASYGVINITVTTSAPEIRIELRDRGHPMPNGQIPTGYPPRTDMSLEDLPEGGFGWFMIRRLTRLLAYERCDGENHLILCLDSKSIEKF